MTVLDESPAVADPISLEEWLKQPSFVVPDDKLSRITVAEENALSERARQQDVDSLTPTQPTFVGRPVGLPPRSKIRRAADELYDRPHHLSDEAWMTLAAVLMFNDEQENR